MFLKLNLQNSKFNRHRHFSFPPVPEQVGYNSSPEQFVVTTLHQRKAKTAINTTANSLEALK